MKNINEINPYIRVAMDGYIPAGWVIKKRIIYDYELIYIGNDSLTFIYDGKRYRCKKGDYIFIRPGISHSFHVSEKDLHQPHIHFDFFYTFESPKIPVSFKDLPEFDDEEKRLIRTDLFEKYPKTPFVKFDDSEKVKAVLFEIISEENELLQKAALMKLIHMLITDNFPEVFEKNTDASQNIAQNIKEYIDSMSEISASLEDFEKIFSYNRFYLERVFKKAYGESLIAYRNRKKMDYAKRLLSDKSVTEVSEMLGYSSIHSFSRAFRLHFGISASEIGKKE